jgi:hypothetical protein
MELLGTISVGFDITDQLLIRFSAFVRCWRRNESAMRLVEVSFSKGPNRVGVSLPSLEDGNRSSF